MGTERSIVLQRIGLLVAGLIAWEGVAGGLHADFELVDPLFVSRPSLIFEDLIAYARSGLLMKDMSLTLGEAFLGLLLGMITGVAAGLLLAHYRTAYAVLDPYLVGFNSLPRPALAPILILWFGLGITSKVFLSWSLVFFIVFYNTIYGVQSINADMMKAIRVMGATKSQMTKIVVLPSVFSWIFAAFRTSVSLALIGAVVGEFVGSTAGLGYRSVIAAGLFNTARVFVILIILMGLGVVLVQLSMRLERYILRWRPDSPF